MTKSPRSLYWSISFVIGYYMLLQFNDSIVLLQPILCKVIDIDDDDHSHDSVIIVEKVSTQTNKGIKIEATNQVVVCIILWCYL